jgi:hypothetical protein
MRLLVIVLLLAVAAVFYIIFLTPAERRARHVRNNEDKIVNGMTVSMVKSILDEPDTTCMSFTWSPRKAEPVMVLEYYHGFASADNLRVLIENDTVIGVVSYR